MAVAVAVAPRSGGARRGRPPAAAADARRAGLLDVAREIFARRGYRATTMDEVAAAAGITKRTLYAWHADKQALFRACVIAGAERFPRLAPAESGAIGPALESYTIDLLRELSREDSYGMGIQALRAEDDFPQLTQAFQRSYHDYLVEPLAQFLRSHGLEQAGETHQATLFLALALAPLHDAQLLGTPLPGEAAAAAHARRCVTLFIHERIPAMTATIDQLATRLAALEDKEAIRALKARYLRACDLKHPNDVRDCFLPGEIRIDYQNFPLFTDRDAFVAVYESMACNDAVFDIHHATNWQIDLTGADSATGLWSLNFRTILAAQRQIVSLGVEYQDVYRRQDGRWWIVESASRVTSMLTEQVGEDGSLTVVAMSQPQAG